MKLLQVYVIDDSGRQVAVTISSATASPPEPITKERETQLEAAIRLAKTEPVVEVALSKDWTFEKIVLALALAGLTFKKFVITDGKAGKMVTSSEKTGDLLTRFRAIEAPDALRYCMQQLINGGSSVRLDPVPDERMRQGGAQVLSYEDGTALGVG